jgi:hypothetical protein
MKKVARIALALSLTLGGLSAAHARPRIIEESGVLTPPPGITYVRFGWEVGTNGEYALVTGERPATGDDNQIYPYDALLYRRVNGTWVFQRILSQGSNSLYEDWAVFPVKIGMKGNLASTQLGEETPANIFRFNGTDWVPAGPGAGLQDDVSIDGDRILYGVGGWDGRVFEPDGSGGWTSTFLAGQPRCCDDEFWGGPVDLLGDRAILATPYTYDLEPQEIPIYERYSPQGWALRTKLQVPAGVWRLGGEVALHVDNAIVTARSGAYVWNSSNSFTVPVDRVQAVNAYARNATTYKFAKEGNLLLAAAFDPDLGVNVINVFRPDAAGHYEHVAILKARRGSVGNIEIDGNTVIAASTMRALSFELPASLSAPQSRFENFESGNGANWTPSAGSQFTVVRSTINGVYRQSSLLGEAYSVLGNTNWRYQGVEADIRPTAFDGVDRWVGVATRFVDMQNHYYVTLRSSGSVQLKRSRGGVITTLASAPFTVQLNRVYRVRLDSIGNSHRVYVNGKLLLSAEDSGAPYAGNAALIMYKARADYDNVVVSATPRGTIFADEFTDPTTTFEGDWTHNGSGQWSLARGAFVQSSVAGEARALIGTPTADQNISVRVRPTAFASGTTSQERWVGAIARYRNDQNYYYLTLRSGNTLSLRKLVNGAITVIGSVPLIVSAGSWYELRLEVIGTALRAYRNGTLVIQATDTTHVSGRVGLMTYKAAAEFDNYLAYQP